MRIVLDLQACQATNQQRGIGRYAMSLAQGIARLSQLNGRAHDVRVVLNNNFPDSVAVVRHAFDGLLPKENFTVFEVPRNIAASQLGNDWRMRAAERIRESYLASLQPDVVHVASLFEGWVDDAVSSVAQTAAEVGGTAITLFDLIPLMRPETYLSNSDLRDWYYRKLQGVKSADLLLAISNFTRSEAISALHLPSDQVINISSAIDDMFRLQPLSEQAKRTLQQRYGISRPFLMYTGGIDFRKNIEGLIKAFGALPVALRQTYQLAIVCKIGDADRARLQGLAQQAGLAGDALVLTGYVPDADLVSLYNVATAFVFPSLHEGFGLPALEAMACGTPTIGADASSVPEVIGRADALFDPTDTGAMTAKIAQVLGDQGFRDQLREHGLAQAQLFSWDASASRALDGFEALFAKKSHSTGSLVSPAGRPRLAYLSPLPPEKSGIADYSADLIAELVRYYEIDVIARAEIDDPWVRANCNVRSVSWFEQHADSFDRIVYHFGNSEFHEHMFDLLERFPGIVVLHDFFLSGIVNHIEHTGRTPDAMAQALYDGQGYPALLKDREAGRLASIWAFPCNKKVLDDATGVIVHSQFSKQLAGDWYGADAAAQWAVIPLLRAAAEHDRRSARQRLGLADDEFVTCSFGMMGPTKLNERLLEAWLASPLANDPRCRLVFVGENQPGIYGQTLSRSIAASPHASRISITGFATPATYRDYLAAADSAVQLRSMSRGETSASILDCLAYGVPTIINANGSAAELPDDVLIKLPDTFTDEALGAALAQLHGDRPQAAALSARALAYVQHAHHPYRIGQQYRAAIEQFCMTGVAANRRALVRSLDAIGVNDLPTREDLVAAARSIALNQPAIPSMPQLLVDISELVQHDAKSGIQRVVRNVLHQLLLHPPSGYRVEPVYVRDGQYLYARNFTCRFLALDPSQVDLQDTVIEAGRGDRFLGLDLVPNGIGMHRHFFVDLRNRGVEVFFVVYDMLPILLPDAFVTHADVIFRRWLKVITTVSDGVLCISRAVADELTTWVQAANEPRLTPLHIGYFHLGADIASAVTTTAVAAPLTSDNAALMAKIKAVPTILMVGTLEPRKSHAQALAAFELLWAQGRQVNLIIVGKKGWLVDALVKRLRNHPENGRRLFWLESASDTLLLQLYGSASGLLAASGAEGFGLPLIEAAQHKLPVIARDIPVFREVAGDHAYYFSGDEAQALASSLDDWLSLLAAGRVPASEAMPWLTWAQSTQGLLQALEGPEWYRTLD